jgi:hypothetical protein
LKRFPIEFTYLYEIHSTKFYNGLLFDISGFKQVSIKIDNINYRIPSGETRSKYKSNSPLIVDTLDLDNPYHGFKSYDEMQVYLLLKNYIQSSLPARSLLLKLMFRAMDEISTHKGFEISGQKFKFTDQEIPVINSIIQIDIISKIMMYIEDLISLLIGMKDFDGNYYGLLDRKSRGDIDLGKRIQGFIDSVENFTPWEWKKMLSYASSDEFTLSPTAIKLIEGNIEGFKKVFRLIRLFRDTHIQIFRRYKHAGLPFRPGYIYPLPFPRTSIIFDSYSMISMGANPLLDVVPLPYSNDVLESYRALTDILETYIWDIVENKTECLRKRINGVIPSQNYSPEIFSQEENSEIQSTLDEFDIKYPNRAYNDVYKFQITPKNTVDMKWYIDLKSILQNIRIN